MNIILVLAAVFHMKTFILLMLIYMNDETPAHSRCIFSPVCVSSRLFDLVSSKDRLCLLDETWLQLIV